MLPNPSSSSRAVLASRTNTFNLPDRTATLPYLPTPAGDSRYKRRSIAEDKKPLKRLKLDLDDPSDSEESEVENDEDEDVSMKDPRMALCRERRRTAFQLHSGLLANPSICRRQSRAFALPTYTSRHFMMFSNSIYSRHSSVFRVVSQSGCVQVPIH